MQMIGTLLMAVFWATGLMDVRATLLEMALKREAIDSMLDILCWGNEKEEGKKTRQAESIRIDERAGWVYVTIQSEGGVDEWVNRPYSQKDVI